MKFFAAISATLTLLCHLPAWSQVGDSRLFIPQSGTSEVPQLDSSRFTVRPETRKRPVKQTANDVNTPLPEKSPEPVTEQAVPSAPVAPVATVTKLQPKVEEVKTQPPVKVHSANGDSDNDDREGDPVTDARVNIVNISLTPSYFYLDSRSEYWFRNYSSSGPGVSVRGDVWFSGHFGARVDYFTTLSADIRAEPDSDKRVLVDHRVQSGGFLYRKYFGKTRRAPSLILGISYYEYQMIVPKQEDLRIRLRTSGPAVSIATRWPTTNYTAWLFGMTLLPKLKVKEQATGISVTSGTNETTYGLGMHIGREYVLDRNHQVFWKLSHQLEKSVYEGQADTNDPIDNAAPTGVSATTGTTMFGIGYTWGD